MAEAAGSASSPNRAQLGLTDPPQERSNSSTDDLTRLRQHYTDDETPKPLECRGVNMTRYQQYPQWLIKITPGLNVDEPGRKELPATGLRKWAKSRSATKKAKEAKKLPLPADQARKATMATVSEPRNKLLDGFNQFNVFAGKTLEFMSGSLTEETFQEAAAAAPSEKVAYNSAFTIQRYPSVKNLLDLKNSLDVLQQYYTQYQEAMNKAHLLQNLEMRLCYNTDNQREGREGREGREVRDLIQPFIDEMQRRLNEIDLSEYDGTLEEDRENTEVSSAHAEIMKIVALSIYKRTMK